MAVKVQFEIGHTAKLKSKKTPEGFTHDWELYVRGVDKSDINHFVDKVVFNLHDSFPKPKRTYKEAPYLLKESGYAGFVLDIDIFFKNRDEPKRVTYSYALDLQQTGPPLHRNEIKKFVFASPSEEFRQKLLKGGGIPLISNHDEKSRDSVDERAQLLNKPKLTSDASKKCKIRPDDSKMQTFETLFGRPITKTTPKVSPDPKAKGSPVITSNKSGSKGAEKSSTSGSLVTKEKPDKTEKKDKHKHNSPHKDKSETKESKKNIDEKHDRRDDKKKDKPHSKERDRSKDKNAKRPPSPKRISSPKRPISPIRSSSAASREENGLKSSTKSNHTEPEAKKGSSSSGKKSKKDKKSHDKDKEREKKDKERDKKDKDDRSNSSNASIPPSNVNPITVPQIKSNSEQKVDTNKKEKVELPILHPKEKEFKKIEKISENSNPPIDKKIPEKHDKDAEKRHKHKKKDKNKEKEKERDHSAKEKKKEKNSKQKDDIKKSQPATLQAAEATIPPPLSSQKITTNIPQEKFSEHGSSDSEHESTSQRVPLPNKESNDQTDSSDSSFPDVIQQPPKPVAPPLDDVKLEKKEKKNREKNKFQIEKEEKKRKRKSKDDTDAFIRKSASPAINSQTEPPVKQPKKEEQISKKEKSQSPLPPIPVPTSVSNNISSSPRENTTFRTPLSTSLPAPSTSNINNVNERNTLTVDYMTELRELQHKIMTLQDNNELQQVVEMIAATGRFEMTNKTFDFDLCALDRTTVQRLQDFLATSVS